MKKKLVLATCLGILTGGFVIGTVATIANNKLVNVSAMKNSFIPDGEPLKEFYNFGEELILPAGMIIEDGKACDASSSYLIYPNGNSISKKRYILDQEGIYKAVFKGKLNGEILYASQEFAVYKKAYEVTGENSYVKYVDHIVTKGLELNDNPSGIECGLAEGDSLNINNVINVSDARFDGGNGTPILKLYSYNMSELAYHNGAVDYQDYENDFYNVKIIDYYDSTNYVNIKVGYNLANPGTGRKDFYANACSSKQGFTGLEVSSKSQIVIDGVGYAIHKGGGPLQFGAHMQNCPGYNGVYDHHYEVEINNTDRFGWSFFYDNESKRIYIADQSNHLVTDLDEALLYAGSEFKGFTTGEVTISVSCSDYYKNIAHFDIESVYGVSGKDLDVSFALDDKAPEISLNSDANNFFIAKDEPFRIFDAWATDLHVGKDVSAKVIYEKGTTFESNVSLNNKIFAPNKPGKYTIVYSAKDVFGNVASKEVTCYCVTTETGHLVDFATDEYGAVQAGKEITLFPVTVSSLNGHEYCDIKAIFEDGTETIIDPATRKFFPKKVGKYQITFYYGDNVKDYVYSYELESAPSDNLYLEDITFPKYLIKDSMNTLDEALVITCNSRDQELVNPIIYVSNDGEAYGSTPIDRENYKVEATNSVKFKYTYNSKDVFESEAIKVVDVGFGGVNSLDMSKYFVGDVSASGTANSMNIETTKSSGDAVIDFINPIAFARFETNITFSDYNFEEFDIVFTDFYNENNQVVLEFVKKSNSLSLVVNGVTTDLGTITNYTMTYDNFKHVFNDKFFNSISCDNPFTEERAYLSFVFKGMTSKNSLNIKKINNTILSNKGVDAYAPEVVAEDIAGFYGINSYVDIIRPFGYDVLSPFWEGSGHFTLQAGYTNEYNEIAEFVTSTDGILLDGNVDMHRGYQVKLEKFGVLCISITYTDQACNARGEVANKQSTNGVSYITVVDRESPTITINGADEHTIDTASINKSTKVRGYKVSDNLDSAEDIKVRVTVISPYQEATDITDTMRFTPIRYGDYTVMYFAYDLAGNFISAHYTIRVK